MSHVFVVISSHTENKFTVIDYVCEICGIEVFALGDLGLITYADQNCDQDKITCDEFIIKKIIE